MAEIRKGGTKMKKILMIFSALAVVALLVTVTISFAKSIIGPGTADGSQGTYFWYRDSEGTAQGEAWKDRGHLYLFAGRTYTIEWKGIDDSYKNMLRLHGFIGEVENIIKCVSNSLFARVMPYRDRYRRKIFEKVSETEAQCLSMFRKRA